METYHVNAAWDDEARTWIGTSPDVPGLCLEAETLEELCDVAASMVPELLEANGFGRMERTPIDVVATKRTYTGTAA